MSSNATSYRQVIECFRNFCSGHYLLGVDRFTHGEKTFADNLQDEKYPFMHVTPTSATIDRRTMSWGFDVFFADKPNTEGEDKQEQHAEALSDMARLCQDFMAAINPGILFGDLVSIETSSATPFVEEDKNVLTGWQMSISIEVPQALNACDIPGTFTFIDPSTSVGGRAGQFVSFGVIAVAGQNDVNADATGDTLTLIAGSNVTITTNATNDSVMISASGSGGLPDGNYGAFNVAGGVAVINDNEVDTDQIAHNSVDNTKLSHMATKTYKGRTSALTGDPEDVPVATLKTDLVLVKADVGLGNVDNTSDANKPVSSATQTALDLRVPYTGATGDVDLGNNILNARSFHVKGTAGSGHLGLKHQSANITASGSESSIGANATGDPVWKNDGNPIQKIMLQNADITGATKTKITYDAKGLVTSGADATTADIADSLNRRYVTDAQLVVVGNTSGTNTGDNATNSQYSGLAASKQDTLISGTNIKTINGSSVLGSGDLVISGSGITAVEAIGYSLIFG
jgi:hypothetical protein